MLCRSSLVIGHTQSTLVMKTTWVISAVWIVNMQIESQQVLSKFYSCLWINISNECLAMLGIKLGHWATTAFILNINLFSLFPDVDMLRWFHACLFNFMYLLYTSYLLKMNYVSFIVTATQVTPTIDLFRRSWISTFSYYLNKYKHLSACFIYILSPRRVLLRLMIFLPRVWVNQDQNAFTDGHFKALQVVLDKGVIHFKCHKCKRK